MESKLVPAAGFAFKTIEITGFQRKFSAKNIAKNIKTLFLMISSSREVKKIIKEFKPDVVVGFGGYVSGPVVRMACKLGVKTAIHEQTHIPALQTRLSPKRWTRLCSRLKRQRNTLNVKMSR